MWLQAAAGTSAFPMLPSLIDMLPWTLLYRLAPAAAKRAQLSFRRRPGALADLGRAVVLRWAGREGGREALDSSRDSE